MPLFPILSVLTDVTMSSPSFTSTSITRNRAQTGAWSSEETSASSCPRLLWKECRTPASVYSLNPCASSWPVRSPRIIQCYGDFTAEFFAWIYSFDSKEQLMTLKRKLSVCNCRMDKDGPLFPFHIYPVQGHKISAVEADKFWDFFAIRLFDFFLRSDLRRAVGDRDTIHCKDGEADGVKSHHQHSRYKDAGIRSRSSSSCRRLGQTDANLLPDHRSCNRHRVHCVFCSNHSHRHPSKFWNSRIAEIPRLPHQLNDHMRERMTAYLAVPSSPFPNPDHIGILRDMRYLALSSSTLTGNHQPLRTH